MPVIALYKCSFLLHLTSPCSDIPPPLRGRQRRGDHPPQGRDGAGGGRLLEKRPPDGPAPGPDSARAAPVPRAEDGLRASFDSGAGRQTLTRPGGHDLRG